MESNRRSIDYKSMALPTELQWRIASYLFVKILNKSMYKTQRSLQSVDRLPSNVV